MKLLKGYENGNHIVRIFDDGTKIKETGHFEAVNLPGMKGGYKKWVPSDEDHFTYDFPENADIKITDYCDAGCAYCHENSTIKGVHGDLRRIEKTLDSLHAGTEMAVGGGNALAHPDLIWFLEKLKSRGVLANITINQKHLRPYKDLICKLVAENLVHGIGISLVDSSNKDDFDFIDTLGNNVVIHTIAGVLDEKDFEVLKGRKILILGYKNLRRGSSFLEKDFVNINHRMDMLRDVWLPMLRKECKVVSFDCLAIEQLDPKKTLNISQEAWDTLFQGADTDVKDKDGNITCATMYIDVPNMTVARMSTAALDKRYSFNGDEDIGDLLKISTQGW
jgi:hypothetical protein